MSGDGFLNRELAGIPLQKQFPLVFELLKTELSDIKALPTSHLCGVRDEIEVLISRTEEQRRNAERDQEEIRQLYLHKFGMDVCEVVEEDTAAEDAGTGENQNGNQPSSSSSRGLNKIKLSLGALRKVKKQQEEEEGGSPGGGSLSSSSAMYRTTPTGTGTSAAPADGSSEGGSAVFSSASSPGGGGYSSSSSLTGAAGRKRKKSDVSMTSSLGSSSSAMMYGNMLKQQQRRARRSNTGGSEYEYSMGDPDEESDSSDDDDKPVPRPRGAGVHPFWEKNDIYFGEVTKEMMEILSTKTSGKDSSEYRQIPPLGKHYSDVWAKEDLMEEQAKGNFGGVVNTSAGDWGEASGGADGGSDGPVSANVARKGGGGRDVNEFLDYQIDPLTGLLCEEKPLQSVCGSFTERLVSCLVSEVGDGYSEDQAGSTTTGATTPRRAGALSRAGSQLSSSANSPTPRTDASASLNTSPAASTGRKNNANSQLALTKVNLEEVKSHLTLTKEFGEMEIRLRKVLYDLGLLDTSYLLEMPEQEDEVLVELKKQQQLLRAQVLHNNEQKRKLARQVQSWMPKYALQKAIEKSEISVEQGFLRRLRSRRKKKKPNQATLQYIREALEERKGAIQDYEIRHSRIL
eukprot:Nk52_evm73s1992 gene=Nk52_evmTU73s1992